MRFIGLKAKNIKNIKAIEISPDGNAVELTGANGAGKSAILDAIFTTLTGTRLDDPIRHGEEKAEVEVDMGDYIARKRWTQKGEYLEVLNKDGDKKQSPQTFLDKVVGKLSFDPLSFLKMKSTEQLGLLKSIVGLDFTDIEASYKKAYDERTVINCRIKDAVAQLKGIEAPDPKTPDEELTFKDELEKINQLREKRKVFEEARDQRASAIDKVQEIQADIDEAKSEIERLTEKISTLTADRQAIEKQADQMCIPPEVTEDQIKDAELALQDIERKNVLIRAAKRYRSLIKDADKVKREADALTERMSRLEQDKSTRIAAAKMPIDGLSISDAEVIYNGIPFARLSTGQQIRVSTAIAMKLNPELKVIFIREGSLLDAEGKKEIFALAKEHDYQVWIESVDESGDVGFFIENGEIVKVDGEDVRPVESVVA